MTIPSSIQGAPKGLFVITSVMILKPFAVKEAVITRSGEVLGSICTAKTVSLI